VYTASVGPFSSNWDRACELYAYIKGGTVDYGEAHVLRFGHKRYGKTYPGVFPQWGENNKIHVIGHSMGGQTARLMAYLLRHGDKAEREVSGNNCSALFSGGIQGIASILTISTPHNGTTLINDIDIIDRIISTAVTAMAAAVESSLFPEFDLKMDQWGITRAEGESLTNYFIRVRSHSIWTEHEQDFSLWDVSPAGASALNRLAPAEHDIYYFSWANEETFPIPRSSIEIPEISMFAPFIPSGLFMGSYRGNPNLGIEISWAQNDGVVNTASMIGPIIDSNDVIVEYTGTAVPGRWHYMGLLSSMDHADVLGIPTGNLETPSGFQTITDFYLHLCSIALGVP
ncbi:MAG: lipase, partial [Spirochaetales bacterium]|nr:lipase [Spirochaetales bacterium]